MSSPPAPTPCARIRGHHCSLARCPGRAGAGGGDPAHCLGVAAFNLGAGPKATVAEVERLLAASPQPPPEVYEPVPARPSARPPYHHPAYPYGAYPYPYGGVYSAASAPAWADPPLPFGFPRRLPAPGKLRVGVLSPCCYLGGADLWIADLLRLCDPARIAWSGVAIRDDLAPIIPEVRASWEAHCPTAIGWHAIRALAEASDVLVAWGVFHSWGFDPARLASAIGRTPLLAASHGSLGVSLVPRGDALPNLATAAVSRAALRALPEEFRATTTIIYNAVDPARIRPTRTAIETRRMLGIPPGRKVAGWLSRVSAEKRPEVFVRAVARLPRDWVAVVAGIGAGEDAMRALAAELAPGRFHFLGARHDVGDVLATFDCMALPTVSEACSLTVNECWAAGVPVVCTGTGMLEEHPGLARVVPNPPTPRQLADAILADHADRKGTAARVRRAREFAARELAPARFGAKWTEAVVSLAPPRRPPTPGLARQVRLARARHDCPDATRPPGCGCGDDVICGRDAARKSRSQCYACIEGEGRD
jgi:glycosyltransferase involved in cell wall biosynthesis